MKALISTLENNRIAEVRKDSEIFDVYKTFKWVDCPDECTTMWTYDSANNEFIPNRKYDEYFEKEGYKLARVIAYKNIGEQLDMLYRELKDKGSIDINGEWFAHIENVKASIPKDNPDAVLQWNLNNIDN